MIGSVVVMEPDGVPDLAGGRRAPKARMAERSGKKLFQQPRLRQLPQADSGRARADAGWASIGTPGANWPSGGHGERRRELPPRIDPQPAGQGRRRLPADHADVPGPGQRREACSLIAYIKSPVAPGDRDRTGASAGCRRDGNYADFAGARRVERTPCDTRVTERDNYLNAGYGLKSWLLTTDHKRIALLYLVSITLFFFLGGLFAVLIRLELLTPQGDLVQAETYNKLFTMHGVDDGLLLPDPVDPGRAGQLPAADDDRRARTWPSRASTC